MAKITTRGLSNTQVTSTNLSKGSALTHNELDSNFINLETDKLENTTDDFTGTLSVKGSGNSATGETRYHDNDDTHYVGIKAPDTVTTSYTLKLPAADGTSGQQLTTDGSGNLSWAASGSGSGGVTVQDEGSALSTTATTLDFVGAGVTASGTGATKTITISGGSSGITVQDEGSSLSTAATTLNFVGGNVTASGTGATKTITIATPATSNSSQSGSNFQLASTSNFDVNNNEIIDSNGSSIGVKFGSALDLQNNEITATDTLTAPDLANESDITSISQNGTMIRVNASDNGTSNTTQAGLYFDQGSGRMNFQLVQDLTGAHSGHSSVGGSGIIHPSLSFQTRDDGSSSTRATMDLMAPYQGGTGDTLTSSGSATGKICDVNTSKRIVYLQDVSGTWTVGHTTTGAPVAGTISGVVSIGTDAVAIQYQSSGFTTDFSSLTKATLGKVRISTKDVMNGRGQNTTMPTLDIEAGTTNLQNVKIDDAGGLEVKGDGYGDILITKRESTSAGNYSIEVATDHTSNALAAGGAAGSFGFGAYSDNGSSTSYAYPGLIAGKLGDGGSLGSGSSSVSNNAIEILTYDTGGLGSNYANTTQAAEFRAAQTKLMDGHLVFDESSNNITVSTTSNGHITLAPNGTGEIRINGADVIEHHNANGMIIHNQSQGGFTTASGSSKGMLYNVGVQIDADGQYEYPSVVIKANSDNGYPNLWAARARPDSGNYANDTYLQNNDIIFRFFGAPYDGDSNYEKAAASVDLKASENHSASALGGKIEFKTTNDGTTSETTKLTIDEEIEANVPFVLKHYTTTQRDALTAVEGSIIYNSTTNKAQVHNGSSWVDLH